MFDSMKKSVKGTLAAIVLGVSTPAVAQATPMVTFDGQTGNLFNYSLTNQSTAPLTQFTTQIGKYDAGTGANIFAPGWSLLSTTAFDLDADTIIDGYKLTFGAASALSYLSPGDSLSYVVASSSNQMFGQPINFATQGAGSFTEITSQPYFSSAATVPEAGSTAALAGLAALGVAAYMRRRKH